MVPLSGLAFDGCVRKPATPFSRVVEDFVYDALAFSPWGARRWATTSTKGRS